MTKETLNTLKLNILWLLAVLFFMYQFVLRLSPGVLIHEIMIKYQISASSFSLLTAFYYIGYAGMQIPMGIIIDRFGVRYAVAVSALLCTIGNIPLALSDHWIASILGRCLVGIGSSAGALGAVSAVRMSFPNKYTSKMIGITVMLGLIGAIYGKSINRLLISDFGMEKSILYIAMPGIIIFILMLFFTKDPVIKPNLWRSYSIWSSLKMLMKDGRVILLSIAGALLVGPSGAFADVFGEAYLVEVYHLSPSRAGYLTASTIYIGMCLGAPLLAALADRFKCHYIINIACGCIMSGAFYLLLEKLISGYAFMFSVMFIIGIMCAYQVIVISIVSDMVDIKVIGIAIALVNMFNMIAVTIYHLLIGTLLDHYWTGELMNGNRVYSEIAYTDALYILPITLMLGAIMFFIIKPKPGIC